jgi:hypothetical protein
MAGRDSIRRMTSSGSLSISGRRAAGLLAACLATACTTERPDAHADSAAPPPDAVAPEARWTVTPAGIGPLRAGMTLADARAALGAPLPDPPPGAECAHVPVGGAPGEVLAMIVDGRVARIEVKDGAVATDRGARVGDSEARIDSLYRGRVRREPHKYTDGSYLVVEAEAPADAAQRLVFETDGTKVVEYRAGLMPAVSWVEGCG